MHISRLYVQNFRNIELTDLHPSPRINIIFGPNGSGKTSLLEAVSYLSLGHSFRGANVHHLIRNNSLSFTLSATVNQDDGNTDSLGIIRTRSKSSDLQISINQKRVKRLLDLIDRICVQVIHPDSYQVVTGGPDQRRAFIDWGAYYLYPEFKDLWLRYNLALKQRNALLRIGAGTDQFESWNVILGECAEKISRMREEYIYSICPTLHETLEDFLPGFKFAFSVSKGWDNDKKLKEILELNLEKDRILGYTFYGCHRADLKIRANQIPAGDMLSRGQTKLLVCAMRLSQGIVLQKNAGKNCIYLIDDLNSELDQTSRSRLISEILNNNNQIFITNITGDLPEAADADPCLIDMKELASKQQSPE